MPWLLKTAKRKKKVNTEIKNWYEKPRAQEVTEGAGKIKNNNINKNKQNTVLFQDQPGRKC